MTVTELVVLWTPAVNVGTHPTRIHGLTAAAGYTTLILEEPA